MKTPQVAVDPKFPLGNTVITGRALDALKRDPKLLEWMLYRHQSGDWGDVCDEDKLANDSALHMGTRILSAYHIDDGTKFWVITEADRTHTTILLPSEY
jgi:hypothetical protein